jgi:catechol 2,3-dioxygenase-like lactoylglutathione lyase family enzyme
MRFEHFALNVPDTRAHARWYVDHLGFTVARQREDAPFTHFLADDSGRIVVELYTNTSQAFLNFATMHQLLFHFAVVAKDAKAERARLEKVGAKLIIEEPLADGSLLIMLRDPWGVPLQLCQRAKPF